MIQKYTLHIDKVGYKTYNIYITDMYSIVVKNKFREG